MNVPSGTPITAPAAISATSRRRASTQARGRKPSESRPSATRSTGAATAGPTSALPAGMKISAAPKPEKPRASPATPATSTVSPRVARLK